MGITTPDYELVQLPNGIRIAHKQVTTTKIAHVAMVLDAGSRDEAPDELGIAHFWEHMAFKGTTHHKAFHICNTLERLGGELNAYTTKEKICFYASVLAPHFKKAASLLYDILFFSTFPEKEIEKERQVILEEMAMYLDSPDDAISDEFDALIFQDHPLGNNILGTQDSVKGLGRDHFFRFLKRHVNTEHLVCCSVGPMSMKQVLAVVQPLLEQVERTTPPIIRQVSTGYVPKRIVQQKPISQTHVMMGQPALPFTHPDRIPLVILANLLGGPAMNSRLNLAVRERHGLTYSIDASYNTFVDTGQLTVYYATEQRQVDKVQRLINRELKLLRDKPLGTSQLKQVKDQIKGQMAMSEESNLNLCLSLGRSLLDAEHLESIPELFQKVEQVTSQKLADLANEFLNPEQWSVLVFEADEAEG